MGLGQLNQANLNPAMMNSREDQPNQILVQLEQGIKGNLHQIQVQFGLGFQPAHQLVFSA